MINHRDGLGKGPVIARTPSTLVIRNKGTKSPGGLADHSLSVCLSLFFCVFVRVCTCECRRSIYSVYGRSWWIDPEGTWL